jgi:hypothetical protein
MIQQKQPNCPVNVLHLVDSLNNIFSDYSLSSEVGKLASMQIVKERNVSGELFQMILRFETSVEKIG